MTAALILAAGVGSRLMPFTDATPKPFLPLGDGSIFGRIVSQVEEAEPSANIFANLHHRPDVAEQRMEAEGLRAKVTARIETKLRGPAGSLLTFRDELVHEDIVVVVSGDVVFEGSLWGLLDSHRASGARMTVATAEVLDGDRFGVFKLDNNSRPVDLVEKPNWAKNVRSTVSAGMYVLDASLLTQVPMNQEWDFGAHWIPHLIRQEPVNLWPLDGSWDDVGSIHTYHRVAREYTTFDAQVDGAYFPGVQFAGRNHVSRDACIGAGAVLRDCVILPGAKVPDNMKIANAVIG